MDNALSSAWLKYKGEAGICDSENSDYEVECLQNAFYGGARAQEELDQELTKAQASDVLIDPTADQTTEY